MERAVDGRELILVRRRSGGDVAMIAERLLSALAGARSETLPDTPLTELQRKIDFDA